MPHRGDEDEVIDEPPKPSEPAGKASGGGKKGKKRKKRLTGMFKQYSSVCIHKNVM